MNRFKFNDNSILVSLDIGTSFLSCLVCVKKKQSLQTLSFFQKPSRGLKEGGVLHFDEALPAIGEVLEESEKLSGRSFTEIVVGFSPEFKSFSSHGMAALISREVEKRDIDLAIQTACAIPINNHHLRMHNKAQEFSVDGKKGILNPLGLSGLRLETQVQIVSVPEFYCQDISKILSVLGFTPRAFVHNLMAFGEQLTSFHQKQEGVCLCDIGHYSTRLIFYKNYKIIKMATLDFGGHHFSKLLSEKFKRSITESETLKRNVGTLNSHFAKDMDHIETEEGLFLSQKAVIACLEEAGKTLFLKIKQYAQSHSLFDSIKSGFVFTGSSCLLDGFLDLARLQLSPLIHFSQELNFQKNRPKQMEAMAIAKQAYFQEELKTKASPFVSKWMKWRELF